jgi:hypothetical protein
MAMRKHVGPHLKKPGSSLSKRLSNPKAFTHMGMGHAGASRFTAPHNRARAGTTTPKGAPGPKSGTTIPRLGKQMSVADVLNFKFPKL